jgi:phosphoribosyl 1,2-cyclic phosphodiesterase
MRFGGNTACIELRFGEDEKIVILDAGSGIRDLSHFLIKNDLPKGPLSVDLLLTHTHWDHILGFPFFLPIFIPKTRINVYGPVTYEEEGLDKIIGSLLTYRYFPVKQSELSAKISYFPLKESTFELGKEIFVTTKYLNHPILCLGYRFEFRGHSVVTAYDTEPFRNLFPTDPSDPSYDPLVAEEGEKVAAEENEKILNFMRGADVLIHDAQYTEDELQKSYLGWGHTSFEHVIQTAHKAGVKKAYFFHHDPQRTDTQLEDLLSHYQKAIRDQSSLQIEMAREGDTIEL